MLSCIAIRLLMSGTEDQIPRCVVGTGSRTSIPYLNPKSRDVPSHPSYELIRGLNLQSTRSS